MVLAEVIGEFELYCLIALVKRCQIEREMGLVLLFEVDLVDSFLSKLNHSRKRIHELFRLTKVAIWLLKLEVDIMIFLRASHSTPPLHHIYTFKDAWEITLTVT